MRKHYEGPATDGTPTTVQRILAGDIDLIVNTPYGVGPRLDGYEIRTAAVVTRRTVHHDRAGAGGDGAGHRGPARAAGSAYGPSRSTQPTWPDCVRRRTEQAHDDGRYERARDCGTRGGGAGQAGLQVKAEVISLRRAGDYYVMSLTAAGIADADPPGALRGSRRRRRRRRHAAAPRLLDLPRAGAGRLRRHRRDRVRGARQGHPVARPAPPPRHRRHRRSARQAVRAAQGAGRLRPRRRRATAPRRCSCSPSSCASAAAASTSCSAPRPRTSCSGRWTPSASRSHATHHDRGRVGRASAGGSPTCCRRCWSAPTRTSSTRAGRWRCSRRSRPSRRPTARTAQCAVEESMACGIGVCMTCVLPVVGDDGVTRMVRSCVEGPVFRRRPRPLGRPRHGPGGLPSAPLPVDARR